MADESDSLLTGLVNLGTVLIIGYSLLYILNNTSLGNSVKTKVDTLLKMKQAGGQPSNNTGGGNTPTPTPTTSSGGIDSNGIKVYYKTTGKFVDVQKGGDPAGNGQRYSVNHKFKNYIMMGYFKLGKGQEIIEMKTDGPNHGSCKKLPECCWIEADYNIQTGQVYFSAEFPHPENHPANPANIATAPKAKAGDVIGFGVAAFSTPDGFRRVQIFLDMTGLVNGKPSNQWKLYLDRVDRGSITNATLAKREIPINYNKGLEAEIRMHKATSGDTAAYFARVYEIIPPST